MGIGILSAEELRALNPPGARAHCVNCPSLEGMKSHISALDLPISDKCWRLKGSCRITPEMGISDLRRLGAAEEMPVTGPVVLQKGNVYLFKLDCELNLRDTNIQGKATARSSIGRLDVLVRLLTDPSSEFDRIPQNYSGSLFAEVTPITFDVQVRPGTCLSQLRLFKGSDRLVSVTQEEFAFRDPDPFPVVVPDGRHRLFASKDPHETFYPFRVNLLPDQRGVSGFVAKRNVGVAIDIDAKAAHDPTEFWDPVVANQDAIELEPDRFYILRSKECLRIPGDLALECQAYTETMGEWRIEYAGFAHPYFGMSTPQGTPLIFEVRGHNIPTILMDGIQLGNVAFKRMSQPAKSHIGQYEGQDLKLSGCFKPWHA
jgi:dCTP deaminase